MRKYQDHGVGRGRTPEPEAFDARKHQQHGDERPKAGHDNDDQRQQRKSCRRYRARCAKKLHPGIEQHCDDEAEDLLLIALAIRALLFHPYILPSGSMYPTMFVGDSIFVSKYAYGYSRYSFPYAPPLFSGRIFGSEPERGDVVAFRSPKDGMTDYVKRVVGLPGDHIQMKQGRLYINDVAVKRERLEDFVGDACGTDAPARVKRWRETLPNGATYETLDCIERGFYDDTNVYTVPSGHFFMLGDNRDNSTDSRVLSAIGYIPFENIIGRVEMVYLSKAPGRNGAAATVRPERLGLMVR